MFFIKYLTIHKVHMHAGAIWQLLYGCGYVREDITLAKAHELSSRTNHTITKLIFRILNNV